jgi:transcriptional regulator with XRE-family HTH domain
MNDNYLNGTKIKVGDARMLIIGERVRNIRKSNGLTQTDVAKRMGVATPVVSELERGLLNPTMNTYFILCAALEIEPHELLGDLPGRRTKRDSNDA